MDRNTIIGVILIFLMFIGYSVYNTSHVNKAYEKTKLVADSLYKAGNYEKAKMAYLGAMRLKPNQADVVLKLSEIDKKLAPMGAVLKADSAGATNQRKNEAEVKQVIAKSEKNQYGAFSSAVSGEQDFITLENNKIELKIALKGGRVYSARLKDYKTHDSKPLILFDGDSTEFGFNFFTVDNKAVQTNKLYFKSLSTEKNLVVKSHPDSISLRLYADSSRYIEYTYTLAPDKYMVNFTIKFNSLENVIAANQSSITLDWKMYIPQQEKGRQNEEYYTTIMYKHFQSDVEYLKLRSTKDQKADIPTRLSWVAFEDQFFSSVLVTNDFFQNGLVSSTVIKEPSKDGSIPLNVPVSSKYIRFYTTELGVPFNVGSSNTIGMKMYFGPNNFKILKNEGMQLERLVFLGKNIIGWINRFVIIPVFHWLERYFASYGLIILILTILIKIVLFPLTFKSYQSTAKMQVLKPLVDELGKKFPKKEDAMKKQQATMDLYKRAGVSPMGGCLPMLLQMPILFAMFRFFPVSIELRQEHFLWATDLSTYDSILTLPFKIPLYGDHVSLFTLLMTASTLLTMKMTGSTPGSDQPGMKMMMYMMPVMFMLILNNFSAGLTYYYFLANMITYLQNIISKRFINAEAVLATLEENKKKPLKKSKWQQRLEDAAKQRGINPPKR
jgi:YidC/Oxa1 family membrane protein insertase